MTKKFKFGVLAVLACMALTAAPVMAAPPLAVLFDVTAGIASDPDPFTASGPAVDAGLVCPTGETTDLSNVSSGPPGGTFTILRVTKRFTCDSGGTFDVKLVVYLDLVTHETTANWNIVGGTGAYAGLHGGGKLAGVPIVPGASIQDSYDGKVH